MNDREKQTILLMAECNLNMNEVARKMDCGRSSVAWFCDKVWKKTGLDPRKFYDLVQLIEKLKGDADNGQE